MRDPLANDDVKILYSPNGAVYDYLAGVVSYDFGVNCTSKDYQPAYSLYTYTAKLSKKANLTLSFYDHTQLDIADPCYLTIALFFAPDQIWIRQAKFKHLTTTNGKTADGIATRSHQFSLDGTVTSYVTTQLNLLGEFTLDWQPIEYTPPLTYTLEWETIAVIV